MLRIGLTGGIACGKSAVAAMIQDRAYPLIDADEAYHQLLAEDQEMLAELRAEYGDGCFDAEGRLDRKALGARVFGDPAALKRLGEITHPRVRRKLVAFMDQAAAAEPAPRAVFAVIPLLFEGGLEALFDRTVVVSVPEDVQEARLRAREGIDAADARRRMASQMPLAEKRRRADHVLDNAGPLEETERALEAWLDGLERLPPSPG